MKLSPYTPQKLPIRLKQKNYAPLLKKAHLEIKKLEKLFLQSKEKKALFSSLVYDEELFSRLPHEKNLTLKKLFLDKEHPYKKMLSYLLKNAHVRFSQKLVLTLHALAMKKKIKGHGFRKEQNWLGPVGKGIDEAYFLPPDPPHLKKSFVSLKNYFYNSEEDPLLQLAIFFAFFLVIHPFMDGNGRVARTLIPYFLYKKKLLSKPLLFMSHYFYKNRSDYFEKLYLISHQNDWNGWILFFLKGLIREARRTSKKMPR